MGSWTSEEQTVESWSEPVETERVHVYSSSYNWYVYISFSVGRRVSDKAVVIRAELYGKKESGLTEQSVGWFYGAKRQAEEEYTDESRTTSTNAASYVKLATAYYADSYFGRSVYDLRFRAAQDGYAWHEYEISVDPAGTIRVRENGEWTEAVPYVRVNGEWKEAQPLVKINGEWKESI